MAKVQTFYLGDAWDVSSAKSRSTRREDDEQYAYYQEH
jgi:hypothetical protein